MNKFICVGRLTKDPELQTTTSGKSLARFSVAVKRDYATDGQVECDFFNCVVWGAFAETCNKYLKKGSKVIVEGRLNTRTYESNDGAKKLIYEINATNVEFLSNTKTSGQENKENEEEVTKLEPINDNDLPF